MQYTILLVSVLVLFVSTGVNADDKGEAPNSQLALPIAPYARDGGVNSTLKAGKLVDAALPTDDSQNEERPVDVPVPAQAAACTQFYLSGTTYKSAIHGTYTESGSYCSSKRVYRAYSYSARKYIYLFYSSSTGQWAFYETKCSIYGYVASVTTFASRPDYVTSWAETNNLGNWVTNSYIRVTCVSTGTPTTPAPTPAPGCNSYELYGCTYKKGIHGWYTKTSYTCSSKPVYSRYSIDFSEMVYLFYTSGQWSFHRTRCGTIAYVSSVSVLNNFPDEVVSWAEVDTSGKWNQNSGIGVKCSSDTANVSPLVVLFLLVCGSVATW